MAENLVMCSPLWALLLLFRLPWLLQCSYSILYPQSYMGSTTCSIEQSLIELQKIN